MASLDGRDSSDANRDDVSTFTWSLVRPDGTSQFKGTYHSTFSRQELAINLVNNIVTDGATAAVKKSTVLTS